MGKPLLEIKSPWVYRDRTGHRMTGSTHGSFVVSTNLQERRVEISTPAVTLPITTKEMKTSLKVKTVGFTFGRLERNTRGVWVIAEYFLVSTCFRVLTMQDLIRVETSLNLQVSKFY